jgi:hypothetical protein
MDPKKAAERVLVEAANHEHFFDFSDAERLTWMLERAFEHGVLAASANAATSTLHRSERRKRPRFCPSRRRGKL